MKVKKILLPIFIGVALMMMSIIGAVFGCETNYRKGIDNIDVDTSQSLDMSYQSPNNATATDRAFYISVNSDLTYTGSAITLVSLGCDDAKVYYSVKKAEYNASDIITSTSYSSCPSIDAGSRYDVQQTNIGTYTIYYYIPASGDYAEVSSSVTCEIKGFDHVFEVTTFDKLTYNGSAQTLMNIKSDTGDVYYKVETGVYDSTKVITSSTYTSCTKQNAGSLADIKQTNAGTYTVYYYIPEVNGYYEVSSSATITIENADLVGSVEISGVNVLGQTLTASVTNTSGATLTYQWYRHTSSATTGGTAISGANNSTYVLTNADVDKYIYLVVGATKANFNSTSWSDLADSGTNTFNKVGVAVTIGYGNSYDACINPVKLTITGPSGTALYSGDGVLINGSAVLYVPYSTTAVTVTIAKENTEAGVTKDYLLQTTSGGGVSGDNSIQVQVTPNANQTINVDVIQYFTVTQSKATGINSTKVQVTWNGNTTDYTDSSFKVLQGSGLKFIATETTGYHFDGWYNGSTKASSNLEYTYSIVGNPGGSGLRTDLSLQARSTVNSYTIAFNAKGGAGTMEPMTLTYTEEKALNTNEFSKTNSQFKGWTTVDYDLSTIPEVQYTDGDAVTMLTAENGATVTLYAIWMGQGYTAQIYIMQTDGQYPTTGTSQLIDATPGTTITISEQVQYINLGEDAEYLVLDYAKNSAGNTITTATIANGNQTVIKFYFKRNELTITFDSNGGSAVNSQTRHYGQAYGELPTPTRTGYTFNGWYNAQTGGTKIESTDTMGNSDITLYAQWTANLYTITLNTNGGTVNPTTVEIAYDSTYSGLPTPTRAGYTFNGWYKGDTKIESTTKMTTASDHALMASWTAIEPTISITTSDAQIKYNEKDVTLTANVEPKLTILYQWYVNDVAISGATSATYTHLATNDAGTYTYYCEVTISENGCTGTSDEVTITVNKADNSFKVTIHEGLVYDGNEYVLLEVEDYDGIPNNVYYRKVLASEDDGTGLNASNYESVGTTNKPTSNVAGTFKIYYYVPESTNYNEILGNNTVTVSKAENLFAIEVAQNLQYNGQEHILLKATAISGTVYYYTVLASKDDATGLNATNYDSIGSTEFPTKTDAGSYNVYYYVPESANYLDNNGMITINIGKTENAISVKTSQNLTYNGSEQVLAQVEDSDGIDNNVYYSINQEIDTNNLTDDMKELPVATKDGAYVIYFYIPESDNYYQNGGYVENTIAPKQTTLTINPNGGVWNGKTENSEFTENNGTTKTISDPTRAGYKFTGWTIDPSNALFDTESKIYTFDTIDSVTMTAGWEAVPPTISISCDKEKITYKYGQAVFTAVAEHELELAYQWYRSTTSGFTPDASTLISGATNTTYTHEGTTTNIGNYYYVCRVTVVENGVSAYSTQLMLTVEKCENILQPILDNSLEYNGAEQVLLEVVDSDGIPNNIYYSIGTALTESNYSTAGSTSLPMGTNAGDYEVYYYIPASTNFNSISGSNLITIHKVENVFTVNTTKDLMYNGSEQVLAEVIDSDGIADNVYYKAVLVADDDGVGLNSTNYQSGSTTLPTGKASGTYNIYFYIPEGTNHLENSGYTQNTIAFKTTTLTINPNDGIWNGKTETSTITGENGDTQQIADPTRAGYRFINWTLDPADALFENGTYTFDIHDVTMTANWEAIPPTISISCDKSSISYGYEQAVFTAVAEHELEITYQWYRSTTCGFTPDASTAISGATGTTYTHAVKEVGIGKYYYVCIATANGLSTTSNEVLLEVLKSDNVFSMKVDQTLEYNKTEQVLLEIIDSDGIVNNVYYKIGTELTNSNYNTTGSTNLPVATDAGVYEVYFYVPESSNYHEISGSVRVKIERVRNLFEVNTPKDLVYNGSEQVLAEVIDSDGIENNVYYSAVLIGEDDGVGLNSTNYQNGSTALPARKAPGTYNIYFYIPQSTNYFEISGYVENTIDYKYSTLTIDPNEGTWDGKESVSVFENQPSGTTKEIADPRRLGYTFTGWTLDPAEGLFENGIYTFDLYDVTMTANWEKAKPKIEISCDTALILYKVEDATFTAVAVHDFPITYQWYCGTTSGFTPDENTLISGATDTTYVHTSDAKTVGVYYYVCIATANGLSATSNELRLEVVKTENVFKVNVSQNLIYDKTEHTLLEVVDSDGIDNNIYYSIGTELTDSNYASTGSKTLPKAIDAGAYEVYFYVPESDSFNKIKGNMLVEIAKAENIITIQKASDLIYNGQEQILAEITDSDGIDNNIYYSTQTELNSTNYQSGSTNLPTGKDSKTYNIYYYIPTSKNYNEVGGYIQNTISPKATTLTIDPNGGTWNGSADISTYTQNNGTTVNVPDPVRPGYKFTGWSFSAECLFSNKVYTFDINDVTMTANWEQVAPTISISCDRSSISYGYEEATFTAVAKHDLEITYQWYRSTTSGFTPSESTAISGAINTTYVHGSKETNVGTYYYVCIATANGLSTTSNEVSLEVLKSENMFSMIVDQNLEYNKTEQVLLEIIDSDGIDNNVYYSVNQAINKDTLVDSMKNLPKATNAGVYEVFFYVPETTNYYELLGNIKVTISKVENVFEVKTDKNLAYNGSEQVLVEVIDSDGIDKNVYYSINQAIDTNNLTDDMTNLPVATDAGTYEIYFYIPESTNHFEISGKAIVEIAKIDNTFTLIANEELLYNGEDQVLAQIIDNDGIENQYYSIGTVLTAENYETAGSKELPVAKEIDTYEVYFYVPETTNYYELMGGVVISIDIRYTALTIDPNGGTWNGETSPVSYINESGATFIVEEEPTRNGFTFDGWDFVGGGTFENGTYTYGMFDSTLTAKWQGIDYTITLILDENGTTEQVEGGYTSSETEQTITIPTKTREGYVFDKWNIATDTQGVGSSIDDHTLTIPATAYGNISIQAVWTNKTYNITWDGNQPEGALLLDAKLWNYAGVDGYTSDNTGSNYQYSFNESVATSTVKYNNVLGYYTPIPVVSGYTFDGWFDAQTGGVKVADSDGTLVGNTIYTDFNKVWINDIGDNETNITLYAQYTAKTYSITYNYNGGNAENAEIYDVSNKTAISVPEREGYVFAGWDIEVSLDKVNNATINQTNGNQQYNETYPNAVYHELFYINEGIEYTGTLQGEQIKWRYYDLDGAFNSELSSSANASNITISGSNKYVAIWYHVGNENNPTTVSFSIGAQAFNTGDYLLTGDLNLSANWTANTYTVIYNGNGATGGSMDSSTHTYGVDSKLTKNAYTKTGYVFSGWSTSADGSVEYSDEQTITTLIPTGSIELFAIWTADTYTVSFNTNGGNAVDDITVTYDAQYGELPTPEYEGYTFDGWYLDEALTESVNSETVVTTPNDHTLHAKWTTDVQTITLDYQGGTDNFLYSSNTQISGTFEFEGEAIGTLQGTGNISTIDTKAFNGSKSLTFRVDTVGASAENRRMYLNVGKAEGEYTLRAYVTSDTDTTMDIYLIDPVDFDEIARQTVQIQSNVWSQVSINFAIPADYTSNVNLYFHANELSTNYYIDDIKVLRTDSYQPTTSIEYNVETTTTKLPYATKLGYTFLGWNTKADGRGMFVTSYGGGEIGNKQYFAIYKPSNTTVVVSADNSTIDYATGSATLTANVITEGVTVESATYQWYIDGVAISGATNSTYEHAIKSQDVGTYTYYCNVTTTVDGIKSKTTLSNSARITVTQSTPTIEIDMDGYTYAGTITSPTLISNSGDGTVTFYYNTTNSSVGGTEWKDMTSTTLNAGTYYMYATTNATTNYLAGTSNIVEFVVAEAEIEIVYMADSNAVQEVDGYNITYTAPYDADGLTFKIGPANVNATVTYWIDVANKTETSVALGNMTQFTTCYDVGTVVYNYTVSAPNYSTISGTVTLIISQISRELVWEVSDSYTYNGQDQADTVKAYITDVNGEKLYANIAFSGQDTTFKDAGTYTATASLDTNNYSLSNTTLELVINKFEITITADDKAIDYSDKAPSYTYTASVDAPDTYVATYTIFDGETNVTNNVSTLNAGTYTIAVTTDLSENNYDVNYVSGTLTINKIANTFVVKLAEGLVYDGQEHELLEVIDSDGIDNNIYYKTVLASEDDKSGLNETNYQSGSTNKPVETNAGNYNIYFYAPESDNYLELSGNANVEISTMTVNKPTVSGEYTFNNTEQSVEINGYDSETMAIVSGDKATNAGDYTLIIKLQDSTNYTWEDGTTANVELSWSIAKYDLANATIADIPEQPFTGVAVEPKPEITALGTTLVEGTHFTYSYSNNVNANENAVVTITAVENSNYTGTNSKTFVIAGAFIDVPTLVTNTLTYNATEQTIGLNGFDSETMEIVSGATATDAGSYTVVIALKNTVNYTWKHSDGSTSKENISLDWSIEKADVTLSAQHSSITARVGETVTNEISITTAGTLDGLTLSVAGGGAYATISASTIASNKSTISISPTSGVSDLTITVTFAGDDNHNGATVTFELDVLTIYVRIVVTNNIGGTGTIDGLISGTVDQVKINSNITFTATPDENYGLVKYTIKGAEDQVVYIDASKNSVPTDAFTSPTITINDQLLGNNENDVSNNEIVIELTFDKVVTVTVNVDETNTGAISHNIVTKYEDNEVVHIYDEENNALTLFENATISLDVQANKDEAKDQWYVVNEIIVGEDKYTPNMINPDTIDTSVSGLGQDGVISIKAAKVYNADSRDIMDKGNKVATVGVVADTNNRVYIDTQQTPTETTEDDNVFVVENSVVSLTITQTHSDYDFLGIVVNGKTTLKDQLNASEWTQEGSTRTWNAQAFTQGLSTAEPIMLERWYEVGNDKGRTVEVQVDSGINAKLINTNIGYSYTLSNNIFSSGTDPLYAGNWEVVVSSATITNYKVVVEVYTDNSTTPTNTYGQDEEFEIDSSVTKVVIKIQAVATLDITQG